MKKLKSVLIVLIILFSKQFLFGQEKLNWLNYFPDSNVVSSNVQQSIFVTLDYNIVLVPGNDLYFKIEHTVYNSEPLNNAITIQRNEADDQDSIFIFNPNDAGFSFNNGDTIDIEVGINGSNGIEIINWFFVIDNSDPVFTNILPEVSMTMSRAISLAGTSPDA